jgi:hypothetical protein
MSMTIDWIYSYKVGYYTTQINVIHRLMSQFVTVSISRCFAAASKGGRSAFSGFPNCPQPQLPASNSNSSQQLNPSGYLTHSNS